MEAQAVARKRVCPGTPRPANWPARPVASWARLEAEFNTWAGAGRTATLWWRDDDAVAATPALDRLLRLARGTRIPLALAVIPALAEPSLSRRLAESDAVHVVQHGYRHLNHAPAGGKKAELAHGRPRARVLAELDRGRRRLAALFGARFSPVLVPPWNRIDAALVGALAEVGLEGLSTFASEGGAPPMTGIARADCHIDVIDWRGTTGFVGEGTALGAAVRHLEARRTGNARAGEATGLMTHHLVHDEAAWAFLAAFLARTGAHRAVRWIAVGEALWPAR